MAACVRADAVWLGSADCICALLAAQCHHRCSAATLWAPRRAVSERSPPSGTHHSHACVRHIQRARMHTYWKAAWFFCSCPSLRASGSTTPGPSKPQPRTQWETRSARDSDLLRLGPAGLFAAVLAQAAVRRVCITRTAACRPYSALLSATQAEVMQRKER